jgi:hypothetical protein
MYFALVRIENSRCTFKIQDGRQDVPLKIQDVETWEALIFLANSRCTLKIQHLFNFLIGIDKK